MTEAVKERKASRPPRIVVEPITVGREDAAELFGIGVSTFEAHVSRGRLPKPRQLGGRAVWLLEELRAAAASLPVSEMLPPPPSKQQDA